MRNHNHQGILCNIPEVGERVEIYWCRHGWVDAVFIGVDDEKALPVFRTKTCYIGASVFRRKEHGGTSQATQQENEA